MKKTRIFAALAAATAAITLTAAVSAYDFGGKLIDWSNGVEVPASEFASVTADSYITIEFTPNPASDYWSLKPCVDDGGWTFIALNKYLKDGEDVLAEMALTSDGLNDAFSIADATITSVTFKVPSGVVDILKEKGMPVIGHGIMLDTMTISDKAPESGNTGNGAGDTTGDKEDDKQNADTGIEGVAAVAGVALIAAAAVVIGRKRK